MLLIISAPQTVRWNQPASRDCSGGRNEGFPNLLTDRP